METEVPSTTATADATTAWLPVPSFPPAAQPDVLLAARRGAHFQRSVTSQVEELCDSLFPQLLPFWAPELKLVGGLLYYGLASWGGTCAVPTVLPRSATSS